MNKNILLIITTGLALTGSGFGVYQKLKRDGVVAACETLRADLEKLAAEQRLRAEEFQKMAQAAQHEAMIQRTICEEQLKDCKGR